MTTPNSVKMFKLGRGIVTILTCALCLGSSGCLIAAGVAAGAAVGYIVADQQNDRYDRNAQAQQTPTSQPAAQASGSD